jgi:WD40 repeat protein
MVASQDPWLFTSVVSSDYDPTCGLAFTSSFDHTVKIWKSQDGSMTALGTWAHKGRVNFVVASKNGTATVATAADVPTEAVRVYHLDRSNISGSKFDSYSCTRVHDEDYVPSEKWAYYPAAIRWGLAPRVKHLLLIGYSPRNPTGEDHLIPEDKLDTGELCLWDTKTKTEVKVNSAKTQNVFEVAWHPSRASFAAATSASQTLEKLDQCARTQIRIFEEGDAGQYGAIKTLDCTAIDINELSIMYYAPHTLTLLVMMTDMTAGPTVSSIRM